MKKIILTEEQTKLLIDLYSNEGLSSREVGARTGISSKTVVNILRENGVKVHQPGQRFKGGEEETKKRYRKKNKAKLEEKHKKWSSKNRGYLREYHAEWRKKNKEKHNETKRNYERNRKLNDPQYKLISNFRTAIFTVLKENNLTKNNHYFDILGYSQEDLKNHLERQFKEDMSWTNYGKWHVDHITPISKFIFNSIDDESFKECWSLNNLQPMWAKENLSKGNRIS